MGYSAGMFIRTKPFNDHKDKVRVQIIENTRDGDKVRQKILRHVGVAIGDDEIAKMKALATEIMHRIQDEREASSPQGNLFNREDVPRLGRPPKKNIADILGVDKVSLKDIKEVRRVVEGVHEVGGLVYETLGFDSLIPSSKRSSEILKDVVLSRMVEPESKRGLQKVLEDQFDKEHDLDAIYRMMDKVYPNISKIKELCFRGAQDLMPKKEVNLALFDVTTLYFESVTVDEVREFGYSKDHRFNTTQVVLAFATSEEGLPLGYELFQGNTAEVKTLLASIEGWKNYLDIKDVCFVADRAMFSRSNLEALEKSGYTYIVAAKLRSLKDSMQEKILGEEGYKLSSLGSTPAWIGEFEYEGKRLITTYKSNRAHQDSKDRETILTKISKTLGKKGSSKKLVTNQGVKKYTSMQDSQAMLDEDKIQADALWDGMHGIITNDQRLTAKEALQRYARLWVIEQSFRINKHDLKMRPIFHWTPHRIESHVALCYMSFAILRHIEYRVSLTQKISPREIMSLLLSVQGSICQHIRTKDLYRIPGAMKLDARKIYKTFNIKRSDTPEIYLK